ncbi:MAG: hypothetical protein JRH09_11970 [Deltaproteobacteria bacterium]|nr:hypothetical protein [Deltaproteobacteria bacterium]
MNSSDSNKSTNVQECPTRLLSDLPADDDAFGSHKRVAQAIVNLIKEEEGGKTIALIGAWGSGKSTVVNFLKNELQNFRDTAVFVFDAWAHEGDPLRRSFLERLVGFLGQDGNGWLEDKKKSDKERWDKKLKQLSNAFEKTKIESTPYLTWPGRFMILSTLLLPVGYILLNAFLSNNNSPITWLPKWLPVWLLGLILIISPLIIVFITYLYWRPTWCFCRQDFWNKHRSPHENDSVFYLFAKNERKVVKSKTVRTPDPTSIEFQNFFRETIVEALHDEGRSLVITIDNLDRLNTKEAISIWATMSTFFEFGESSRRPAWVKRLWLLVPFSPQAPQRLWKNLTAYEKTKKGENNGQKISKEPVEEKSLAEEFVDKTFQVVFQVPLPVMSDWKNFFKKELIEALPNHDKDSYAIYRIFEKKRSDRNRPPTPREIKLFINKLGAYHRIWHDEIPLSIQAWYVLKISDKLKTQSPEAVLLDKKLLSDDLKGVIKEAEWQKYLAALYFNVDIDKAMQVLIGDEIKDFLSYGNGQELKKLQEQVEHQGFITVLENIIADNSLDWEINEPTALAKAAVALKALEQIDSPEWQRIQEYIRDSVRKAEWTNIDKELGEGLVTILEDCPKEQYERVAQAILEHILVQGDRSEDEETPQVLDPTIIKPWTEGLLRVLRSIHKKNHGNLIREHFRMPGNDEFYVEVMRALAQVEVEENLIEYFAPSVDAEQIVACLATLCEQGQFDDSYAYALQLMLKLNGSWPLEHLVTALNERLQAGTDLQTSEIVGCVGVLILIAYKGEVPEANEILNQLSTHGHLAHHLHQAQAENDTEAVSLCLLPILDIIPAGNLQGQVGNSQAGIDYYNVILSSPEEHADTVDGLTQLILKFKKVEDLVQKVESASKTEDLVSSVLERIIEGQHAHEYITPALLIERYDLITGMLSEETCIALVSQLVEKANLLSKIQEYDFDPDLSELHLRIFNVSKDQRDADFEKFLLKGIASVQKDTWSEEFDEESDLLKLVLYLVEDGMSLGLSVNFHDALREYSLKVLDKQISPSIIQDKWTTLLGAFTDSWKDNFLKNLWDDMMNQANRSIELGLHLYGNELLHADLSKDKAGEVVRRLFSEILNRKNMEELIWLSQALQETNIWKKCPKASKDPFRDRIKKEIREVDIDEVREQIDSIARTIGIDVRKIDVEDDKSAGSKQNSDNE